MWVENCASFFNRHSSQQFVDSVIIQPNHVVNNLINAEKKGGGVCLGFFCKVSEANP